MLAAGVSRSVSMKRYKRFKFNAHQMKQNNEDALGKLTMFPLICFHGTLGHLTSDTDSVAPMKLTLGCQFLKKIQFSWMGVHRPLIAVTNSKAITGDYEGPAMEVEVADDV